MTLALAHRIFLTSWELFLISSFPPSPPFGPFPYSSQWSFKNVYIIISLFFLKISLGFPFLFIINSSLFTVVCKALALEELSNLFSYQSPLIHVVSHQRPTSQSFLLWIFALLFLPPRMLISQTFLQKTSGINSNVTSTHPYTHKRTTKKKRSEYLSDLLI